MLILWNLAPKKKSQYGDTVLVTLLLLVSTDTQSILADTVLDWLMRRERKTVLSASLLVENKNHTSRCAGFKVFTSGTCPIHVRYRGVYWLISSVFLRIKPEKKGMWRDLPAFALVNVTCPWQGCPKYNVLYIFTFTKFSVYLQQSGTIFSCTFWCFFDHASYYRLISFTNFNAQFPYSITIWMLHYNPRHVSNINMPIFRRTNCIITASVIVTLCTVQYSMPDESRLFCSLLSSGILYCTVQRVTIPDAVIIQLVLLKMGMLMLETCRAL